MDAHGLVVIGSGPAGVSAAEAFRENDGTAPVRIMTADADPPYARPPLSKDYLRGETEDAALHPAQWYTDRDIELHHASVEAIDVADHAVIVDGEPMPYGALILACGATPTALPVPGGERALTLRSLADARRLRDEVGRARSAVVVGAGFIGCEAAASLAVRGVDVTLVAPEQQPQRKRLGAAAGEHLLQLVTRSGVRFLGGASVAEVTPHGVRLEDGRELRCDVVLAATGVTPRSGLAEGAGLALDGGRVVVDAHMRTSAAEVYAAGDVALAANATAGRRLAVEHWGDAMTHGEIAGRNAAGAHASWTDVPGFWTEIGDATVKYHAWGDGYDGSRLVERDGGFTVWYERAGAAVGVLTCEADDDYELGEQLIAGGRPAPVSTR